MREGHSIRQGSRHRPNTRFLPSGFELERKLLTVPAFFYTGDGTTTLTSLSLTDFDQDDSNPNPTPGGGQTSSQTSSSGVGFLYAETEQGSVSATVSDTAGGASDPSQAIDILGSDMVTQTDSANPPPGQWAGTQSQTQTDSVNSNGTYSWTIADASAPTMAASTLAISFSIATNQTETAGANQGAAFADAITFNLFSSYFNARLQNGVLTVRDSSGTVIHNDPNFGNNGSYQVSINVPIPAGTTAVTEAIAFNEQIQSASTGSTAGQWTDQVGINWGVNESVSNNN